MVDFKYLNALTRFTKFIEARELVRVKGTTKDPILKEYRFCNVNREHDRVTVWIDRFIRRPNANSPTLWFNLAMSRFINWPPSLARLGYWLDWDEKMFIAECDKIAKDGKLFGGAYIVSTNGMKMVKHHYVAKHVLTPLWNHADLRPDKGATCQQWADWLRSHNGLAGFMSNQIVTDFKYTHILPRSVLDWETFVMAGPGTKRGLNRLFGRPVEQSLPDAHAKSELMLVRTHVKLHLDQKISSYFTDLNNLSNCFCEFDKYERARLGEGRPKAKYNSHKGFYDV